MSLRKYIYLKNNMSNLEPIEEKDLDLKHKFIEEVPGPNGEEKQGAVESNKEFVLEQKEARKEGAVEKEDSYSKIISKVQTAHPSDDQAIPNDAKSISAEQDAEIKIEKLIQLATHKGVVHAVKVAKHMEDNYTLDEFHDRLLADELHDALVKKGLIREL